MTEKETKTKEREKEVKNDEGNQRNVEMKEQAKYCQHLISTFKTKEENKSFLKKARNLCIVLIIILLCALPFIYKIVDGDGKQIATDVIFVIEMPLVLFIITDSISSVRNTKIDNENRINEFIKTAMPLFTAGFLNDEEYINIKNYYLHFTNPNDDECKKLISKEERPDVL